jgi:hypothetical protein
MHGCCSIHQHVHNVSTIHNIYLAAVISHNHTRKLGLGDDDFAIIHRRVFISGSPNTWVTKKQIKRHISRTAGPQPRLLHHNYLIIRKHTQATHHHHHRSVFYVEICYILILY